MKVRTLVAAMLYEVDEVELYKGPGLSNMMSRLSPDTLRSDYGDRIVKQFWISVDSETDLTVLRIVLKK